MKSSQLLVAAATLACGAMLAMAAPAFPANPSAAAQMQGRQRMSPAQRAKAQVGRIDKAVTLNDDQKTKMVAIYEKAYTDMASAMQSGDRSQLRSINEQATKDAQALLTPDQLANWPKPRSRRGGGGGALV
ncbi:MAG: hypothetical protein ACRD1C_01130 [Terriglobales bacterium]